jgi:subtilisin family serine protease
MLSPQLASLALVAICAAPAYAGVYESYDADPLTLAAKRAAEAGIVVVATAGNFGQNDEGEAQYGGITAPGNAPWVLTVGVSSHMGTIARDDDAIAGFSSGGPSRFDFAAKPDVVAPGVGLVSLSEPGSQLYDSRPLNRVWGLLPVGPAPYFSLSGTSMAAPVVAGTVALMLQANPSLTPNAVKAILQYTSETRSPYNHLTQGAGFLNARGAVEFANAWATNIVWGTAATSDGENIVWGMLCPTGDCENIVWGTADPSENIIWSAAGDDENIVWSTLGDGENIVWGMLFESNGVQKARRNERAGPC